MKFKTQLGLDCRKIKTYLYLRAAEKNKSDALSGVLKHILRKKFHYPLEARS